MKKILAITLTALLFAQVESKGLANECLVQSDVTEGQATGEKVSDLPTLTSSKVTSEMRVHSIKSCSELNEDGENLVGIQLILGILGTSETV